MRETKLYRAPLACEEIMEILPHRYPFLMVDRVDELEPGRSVVARRCVSRNEPWFQGHFPDQAILPGVILVETLAQAAAIAMLTLPEHQGKMAVLAALRSCRFRRLIRPGDVLRVEAQMHAMKLGMGRATGRITVDGEVAFEGDIQSMFVEG